MTSRRAILLVLVLACSLPVSVRAAAGPVGRLIALEGRVEYSRQHSPWYAAYPEMDSYLRDRLRTGRESMATLEFDIGGRVALKEGTTVEIVGEREVEEVVPGGLRRLVLKAGGLWARITRQKRSLQVQTAGGVMGIRGTEFVVETEPEGDTVLAVFEGEVEVRPEVGEPLLADAGTKVTIPYRDVPVVKKYEDPEDLRREFREAWGRFYRVAGPLIAAAGGGRYLGYASLAVDLVTDPAQAARDYAARQVDRVTPGIGGFSLGGLLAGAGSGGGQEKPDFPTGLAPDRRSVEGRPEFRWNELEGAARYVLLLSRHEEMETLDWAARVEGNRATYPENGRPLPAGKYYWRLIALDGEGNPLGRASQTWFEWTGWEGPPPPPVTEAPVAEPGTAGEGASTAESAPAGGSAPPEGAEGGSDGATPGSAPSEP